MAERFVKVRHPQPMLSLSNAFTPGELRAWRDRTLRLLPPEVGQTLTYVVEPKIDGLTVVLHYDCLLYTSPSPRDRTRHRMPSSA